VRSPPTGIGHGTSTDSLLNTSHSSASLSSARRRADGIGDLPPGDDLDKETSLNRNDVKQVPSESRFYVVDGNQNDDITDEYVSL
jgi:hypothetical protein